MITTTAQRHRAPIGRQRHHQRHQHILEEDRRRRRKTTTTGTDISEGQIVTTTTTGGDALTTRETRQLRRLRSSSGLVSTSAPSSGDLISDETVPLYSNMVRRRPSPEIRLSRTRNNGGNREDNKGLTMTRSLRSRHKSPETAETAVLPIERKRDTRSELLNELKATDNKIYDLLMEEPQVASSPAEEEASEQEEVDVDEDEVEEEEEEEENGDVDSYKETDSDSEDDIDSDDTRIDPDRVAKSRQAVTYYKSTYNGERRFIIKVRYKRDKNGGFKIETRGRRKKGTAYIVPKRKKKAYISKIRNIIGNAGKKQRVVRIKARLSGGKDQIEKQEEEVPFNGILPYDEANTYYTAPTLKDREIFDMALQRATILEKNYLSDHKDGVLIDDTEDEEPDETVEVNMVTSKIRSIYMADFKIRTWYTAPYPEEYSSKSSLYICEYCLKYMNSRFVFDRHLLKCPLRHPPGYEVYRDEENRVAVFEIDGRKNTVYCQSLCLLAKLFLNSKTLYYDVDPFMFYVLTELDDQNNYHFVGYFSKEKLNSTNYNVSCILTLPIYQRKGYGNLLIDFSYLLTRREFKLGTPEKPLSDLGLLSYRNYWCIKTCYVLRDLPRVEEVSIDALSNMTGILQNDIVTALEWLEFLIQNSETGEFAIKIDLQKVEKIIKNWESKNYCRLKPDKLLFKPVIFGPSGGINTTSTMVLTTPAPQEEQHVEPHHHQHQQPQQTLSSDNGDHLMKGISMITSFLRDDLEDHRNMEIQTLQDLQQQTHSDGSTKKSDPDELDKYLICYPGMGMVNKRQQQQHMNKSMSPTIDNRLVKVGLSEIETRNVEDRSAILQKDKYGNEDTNGLDLEKEEEGDDEDDEAGDNEEDEDDESEIEVEDEEDFVDEGEDDDLDDEDDDEETDMVIAKEEEPEEAEEEEEEEEEQVRRTKRPRRQTRLNGTREIEDEENIAVRLAARTRNKTNSVVAIQEPTTALAPRLRARPSRTRTTVRTRTRSSSSSAGDLI